MADRRLLKEHFYTSFVKICAVVWQNMSFFHFLHYKSMETPSFHNKQTKELIFIQKHKLSIPQGCYRWNLRSIGPVTSEEMPFENVDARRQKDEFITTPMWISLDKLCIQWYTGAYL